jgi:hypothetical protein
MAARSLALTRMKQPALARRSLGMSAGGRRHARRAAARLIDLTALETSPGPATKVIMKLRPAPDLDSRQKGRRRSA